MKVLAAGLEWLDLLIHREIVRLRARYRLSLDEFRGLYVSNEQVDALVREISGCVSAPPELELQAQEAYARYAQVRAADSPFARLCREFGLNEWEQHSLLIALAPELDAKYETLYAYLNNDVTKKAPTISLIARLLIPDDSSALQVRTALLPDAPLLRHGLVHYAPGSDRHATLNAAIVVHRSLPGCALGLGFHVEDGLLARVARSDVCVRHFADDSEFRSRIVHSARAWDCGSQRAAPVWLIQGRDAERRADAVRVLAQTLGLDLLSIECASVLHRPEQNVRAFRDALLWQRLTGAVLHLRGLDQCCDNESHVRPEMLVGMRLLRQSCFPICIDSETTTVAGDSLRGAHVIPIRVPELARDERASIWRRALDEHRVDADTAAIASVADSFALTVEQIERAAQMLADDPARLECSSVPPGQFAAAARSCSDPSLARLAQKLQLPFEWKDLVLPSSVVRRLRDIAQAIRDRQVVFGEWGCARLAGGFGLRVLFAGPSGTGKTMAAATIARELGIDIFRVDISQTVSKYIGETEKNLDRIFGAAATSNAILFFDEADALFGKRSEVKDAHDRYSNIETAYLLQKIEEYQGILFLASNLSRNMDSAFARRLNFVVDFPLPEKADRERLWRSMLSGAVPLADDIDYGFLATQFTLSGGEIRNVVLDAAFLAARSSEQCVAMKSLIVALGRQLTKQGRALSATDFKQHHELLVEDRD